MNTQKINNARKLIEKNRPSMTTRQQWKSWSRHISENTIKDMLTEAESITQTFRATLILNPSVAVSEIGKDYAVALLKQYDKEENGSFLLWNVLSLVSQDIKKHFSFFQLQKVPR